MTQNEPLPKADLLIGVDFSGAALAGEKIWVAVASYQNKKLHIESLQRGSDLPASAPEREKVFPALVDFLRGFPGALIGFDFPFSLQEDEIKAPDWKSWLEQISRDYSEATEFKATFTDTRRRTDVAAKTPFSPLNQRLFRQTFYGIHDVLAPLVQQGALVPPLMPVQEGSTLLLEICPASLLKREKLYLSYKGKSELQRTNREQILQEVTSRYSLVVSADHSEKALTDSEGDALDAILAVVCCHNAVRANDWKPKDATEALEGKVYF